MVSFIGRGVAATITFMKVGNTDGGKTRIRTVDPTK